MGLVIFDSDTKSYSIVNKKKEYVEIIKLADQEIKQDKSIKDIKSIETSDNSQKIIKRPKTYKKKKKLSKENRECLNGIISGSGFKSILLYLIRLFLSPTSPIFIFFISLITL
uniref:Uncharacterized protein n=1 Tax=Heterorhabditis bacteriophora TaxID=37862 RepID=A0A1I7W601_HETBA